MSFCWFFFFFFQAEDGIRDHCVTGVQTCALPISHATNPAKCAMSTMRMAPTLSRSEERRVGKSVDLGGRRIIKKKKKTRAESKDKHLHNRNKCDDTKATVDHI